MTDKDIKYNDNEDVTLIVTSHGIWCSYENQKLLVEHVRQEFLAQSRQNIIVYPARCNTNHTCDGIMEGGEKLAQEIYEQLQAIPERFRSNGRKVNFGVIGHSMGGLYMRAMLPFFLKYPGVRDSVRFCVFMSLDSPHLGSYSSFAKNSVVCVIGGKSGCDLGLYTDTLLRLVDAEHMDALALFEHRVLAAVVWGDILVPYCSASGRLVNPYTSNVPFSYWAYLYYWLWSSPAAKFEVQGYSGFDDAQAKKLGLDPNKKVQVPTAENDLKETTQSCSNDKDWLCCNEGYVGTYAKVFSEFCSPDRKWSNSENEGNESFWKRLDLSFGPPERHGWCIHEMVIGKKQRKEDLPACKDCMSLLAKIIEQDTK